MRPEFAGIPGFLIRHVQLGVAVVLAWFTISEVPLHLLLPILVGLAAAPFRRYPSFRWPKDEIPERLSVLAAIVWLIVLVGAWVLDGSLSIRLLAFSWIVLLFWVFWSIRNTKARLRNDNQRSHTVAVPASHSRYEVHMTACPVHQTPLMEDGSVSVCPTCEGTWLPREAALATIGSYYRPSSRRATELMCPVDGSLLRAITRGGARLNICADCGGVWLDKNALAIATATKPRPRSQTPFLIFVGLLAVLGIVAAVPLLKGAIEASTGGPWALPAAVVGWLLGLGALGLAGQAIMFLVKHFRKD